MTIKVDLKETYLESIAFTFICGHCGCKTPENKGQLARSRETPLEEPTMSCIYCIKDFNLYVIPDPSPKAFE